ncbi:hypothetical protein JQ629_36360 [Bradyrhizobium sp. AUGA SZCCT0222]|uniref:hypothetical protein n=1 Tax=Bradyrhizobium sp. AUGA SZCCT0222 TaxID=2807668 RepID=UPI001BABC140|nr:hypothetical protein [Bradyrhizobium sp. AUGA SZCCT0222]MBR1272953.1 hypothetical protein [Bradyrhizobium sp. AUGA SZCCT0222]
MKRGFYFLLMLVWLPSAAMAQSVDWQRFVVPESGAVVDIPTAVFSKEAGKPESGYGRLFETSDGRAKLTVQSIPNVAGDSPAVFLAKKNPPPNIVYKKITPRFFAVSSFRNDNIWYNRCNFSSRLVNCVLISYPASEKRQWDAIVTRISNTLSSR